MSKLMDKIFDVSKYNNIFTFILSVPFIALTWLAYGVFVSFAYIAMLLGRRRAFKALYKLKEWM